MALSNILEVEQLALLLLRIASGLEPHICTNKRRTSIEQRIAVWGGRCEVGEVRVIWLVRPCSRTEGGEERVTVDRRCQGSLTIKLNHHVRVHSFSIAQQTCLCLVSSYAWCMWFKSERMSPCGLAEPFASVTLARAGVSEC